MGESNLENIALLFTHDHLASGDVNYSLVDADGVTDSNSLEPGSHVYTSAISKSRESVRRGIRTSML